MQIKYLWFLSLTISASLVVSLVLADGLEQDYSLRQARMTLDRLGGIIKAEADTSMRNNNFWLFTKGDVQLMCVCDVKSNRMRIVAPISAAAELSAEQKDHMLLANFHSALDARYAVSDGVVYAAFIHPLAELSDSEVRSAIRQVRECVRTFGGTYSSGELIFGGDRNSAQDGK